jgi:hypothetical protein
VLKLLNILPNNHSFRCCYISKSSLRLSFAKKCTLQLCLTGRRPIQPESFAARASHDSSEAAVAVVVVVAETRSGKIRARLKPPPP